MRVLNGLFVLLTITMQGQNLVYNPSFEIFSQCPSATAQVSFATGWYDPTDATSDYFNACSTNGMGVPNNVAGSQPARTGNAYLGFGIQRPGLREYVTGTLIDTLTEGKRYCVEFYVSLCGGYSSAAIDQLGAYFSAGNVFTLYEPIIVEPQIESPKDSILRDTVQWIRISGSFTALGNERYITIGNFRADSLITYDTLWPSMQPIAYYYIDDVSVTEIADCVAGVDASICYRDSIQMGVSPKTDVVYSWSPIYGLSDPNISNPIAFPDTTITYTLTQIECEAVSTATVTVTVDHGCHSAPAIGIPSVLYGNQNLFISGLETNSKLELFDERGRLIFSESDYQNGYWTSNLTAGIYIAQLTRPNGEQIARKVCVVKD